MGLGSVVPVEYFGNKSLEFLPDNKTFQRFEVCIDPLVVLCAGMISV